MTEIENTHAPVLWGPSTNRTRGPLLRGLGLGLARTLQTDLRDALGSTLLAFARSDRTRGRFGLPDVGALGLRCLTDTKGNTAPKSKLKAIYTWSNVTVFV